jgi:hypothetical protein
VDSFLADLGSSKPKPKVHREGKANPSSPKWIPPPTGVTKINVDAGVARDQKSGVIAAVARSASGEYLGASAVVVSGVADPKVLEILAVREGLCLADDLLIRRVRAIARMLSRLWRRRTWEDTVTSCGRSRRLLWRSRRPPFFFPFRKKRRPPLSMRTVCLIKNPTI